MTTKRMGAAASRVLRTPWSISAHSLAATASRTSRNSSRVLRAAIERSSITSDRVTMYAVDRQAQDAANATINRELAALKHAFRLAADAGRVASIPRIKLLEENNAREGFVEHAQFLAIREALPAHLKDPVSFLYHSGWRVNEMRTLEWRDVFGENVVLRRERSKSKKPRTLPLKGELAEIIQRAEAVRRPDCRFVFHVDGQRSGAFESHGRLPARRRVRSGCWYMTCGVARCGI